jgi:hypothetical protein
MVPSRSIYTFKLWRTALTTFPGVRSFEVKGVAGRDAQMASSQIGHLQRERAVPPDWPSRTPTHSGKFSRLLDGPGMPRLDIGQKQST